MKQIIHLFRIDYKKLKHYRTFWVIIGMYFIILGLFTSSFMEFLKWLKSKLPDMDLNVYKIPLYHFPDIWQNITYASSFFKIMVGVLVVISITNEYSYRTLRQNVIDGVSRLDFLISKIATNLGLSVASALFIFVIGLVTGLIYTPELEWKYVVQSMPFVAAYGLQMFTYLSFALMLGIIIQRSGLTILLLMFASTIELIIKLNLPDSLEVIKQYFPMDAIDNLVPNPFLKYVFQEIQDYVSLAAVAIAMAWMFLFNYFSYRRLKSADI